MKTSDNLFKVSSLTMTMAAVIALSGCSQPSEGSIAVPDATPPVASQVALTMAGALTQDQAGATYSISKAAVLVSDGQAVRLVVTVDNSGSVDIGSAGDNPVNLGVSIVDDAGVVVDLDFMRAVLPVEGIGAGKSADVIVDMPLERVVGKKLRFSLVQEGVAWYTDFGVAPLNYGPLSRCEVDGQECVCDVDGKALEKLDQQQ